MPRIKPLALREFPREMRQALAAMTPPHPRHPKPSTDNRPKALNTLGTLAHHPALAQAYFTFNGHLLMATTLSERQRELLIMRVAAVRGSGYEWIQHLFMARDAGLTDEEISRIAYGPSAPFWEDLDAALLSAVDELIGAGGIGAETWQTLVSHLDTQQVLDLIFTVGGYDILARMFDSLEVEIDSDIPDLLKKSGHSAGGSSTLAKISRPAANTMRRDSVRTQYTDRTLVEGKWPVARIEPLPPKEWSTEMRDALKAMTPPSARHVVQTRSDRPKGKNTMGTLAHHPALARAWFTFNGHILMSTTLTARQRELLVMRVAVLRNSAYQWAQHVYMAHDAGIDDEEISRIGWGPSAPFWSESDATLLRVVDELILDGKIGPETWAGLADDLDTQQILDVIFTVGAYEVTSWMFNSVGVELDDDIVELRAKTGNRQPVE